MTTAWSTSSERAGEASATRGARDGPVDVAVVIGGGAGWSAVHARSR